MKKFFGWLFIIAGIGNIIRALAMASNNVTQVGGQSIGGILFFGIGFIGLGIWMVSSSKPNNKSSNLPDGKNET